MEAAAKTIAYRLDPQGYVERLGKAESERRVSVRPAPDVMSRLSALLPVAQGVACQAALTRHADTLIGTGDGRTRGQIKADTLVERVTGQVQASEVGVEINLVMTDETLRADDGQLVAMDSRRRSSTAGHRRFIDVHVYGGPTSVRNCRGACAACNHARQAPGWHASAPEGAGIEVVLQTPTGRRYSSRPPDPPTRERETSAVERVVRRWLRAA